MELGFKLSGFFFVKLNFIVFNLYKFVCYNFCLIVCLVCYDVLDILLLNLFSVTKLVSQCLVCGFSIIKGNEFHIKMLMDLISQRE
jgi:hypothetical protein